MSKEQFLQAIRKQISGLPKQDIERFLDYYAEMVDDRMEDGLSEEEAVEAMGTVDEIVEQILEDATISEEKQQTENRQTENRQTENSRSFPKLGTTEIVLLILGIPVWLPLLLSVFVVLLSVYVTIWSVIVTLYVADVAFVVGAVAGIGAGVMQIVGGELIQAIFLFGSGLVCAGISILWFFGCNLITKYIIKLTAMIFKWLKGCIVRKEDVV